MLTERMREILILTIKCYNQVQEKLINFSVTLLLLFCLIWNDGQAQGIVGTTWGNSNYDDCTSTIKFLKVNTFQYYYCGIDEAFRGIYSFAGDTLKLDQYEVDQTPISFGGTNKSNLRFRSSFLHADTTLIMLEYSDVKYKYEEKVIDPQRNFKLINN